MSIQIILTGTKRGYYSKFNPVCPAFFDQSEPGGTDHPPT